MKISRVEAGSGDWDRIIRSLPHHNVYQTSSYHQLASEKAGGKPWLLVFEDRHCRVAIPMLVREIDWLDTAPGLRDVTSVYGYPGILTSSESLPKDFGNRFRDALQQEMIDQRIVSFFLRLSVNQTSIDLLQGLGELEELGPAVMLDLRLDDDERRRAYRRNHRQDIESLRRLNVTTLPDPDFEHLVDFERAYQENMSRVKAVPWFNFGLRHFRRLCTDLREEVVLMHTTVNNEYCCGGIFFCTNEVVYAHLVGTGDKWLSHSPMKILFDDAASYFRRRGCKWLVLGGGVGCQRDSLFRFKAGFSNTLLPFQVWKWVVDPNSYQQLCRSKIAEHDATGERLFFPVYRDSGLT